MSIAPLNRADLGPEASGLLIVQIVPGLLQSESAEVKDVISQPAGR